MKKLAALLLTLFLFLSFTWAFQSDELLLDEEEFVLDRSSEPAYTRSPPAPTPTTTRRRFSDPDSDSKIQFSLEHAFGDADFSPAGTFSARLKTWSHGGQTLTKLRFSRTGFTDAEKENFEKLLRADDFYRIRLPSNVLSPPGREYVISSVKARCLIQEGLDEHFVIHTEGINILAVNYGSPGACIYPRQLRLPTKWSFNSRTVLKNSEQAPRTPMFAEDILGGVDAEGEAAKPPEKSFWAKYWMYLLPLGFIIVNAMTQAMNMPEEQAGGQTASQGQQSGAVMQRGPSSAVRRR